MLQLWHASEKNSPSSNHTRGTHRGAQTPDAVASLAASGSRSRACPGGLHTVYRNPEINRWGSISAIYLLIPNLILTLIPIALLVLAIYGMSKLLAKMPAWMFAVQALFARIYAVVRQAADKLAAPVLAAGGFSEGLKAARRKISR